VKDHMTTTYPAMNVLLGVTASVAAVKTPELVDALFQSGRVQCIDLVISESAKHFIEHVRYNGALVLDTLTRLREIYPPNKLRVFSDADEWATYKEVNADSVLHIELVKRNHVLLLAPLSANSLSSIANGACNSLLMSIVRAWPYDLREGSNSISIKPFCVAPAMNTIMWQQRITQEQVGVLTARNVCVVEPVVKRLACGDIGNGAMADIRDIVKVALNLGSASFAPSAKMESRDETVYDAQAFFKINSPPDNLEMIADKVKFFLEKVAPKTNIVLITSGGTSVPLEKHTVRSIDNFSTGGRGAASCEHFLDQNCSVIFLHRRFSILPFQRQLRPLMEDMGDKWKTFPERSIIAIKACKLPSPSHDLLAIPFTSIVEYLFYLRCITMQLKPFEERAIMYLAAAVSDFYVPEIEMCDNKIQSTSKGITLTLRPVPKMLAMVRSVWAPKAFLISFKLETESQSFLLKKATTAMQKYGIDIVVANMLQTYKQEVTLIYKTHNAGSEGNMEIATVHLAKNANGSNDLEQDIVRWILEQQDTELTKANEGSNP
jgi:phosphopantothenate---cysteine ligase (ATP)